MPVWKPELKVAGLTTKEKLFVSEYWVNEELCATAAAKRAGFKGRNAGTQLMKKGRVLKAIETELKKRWKANELTREAILKHLCTALFLDPIYLFESNGNGAFRVKELKEIPEGIRKCINKLKTRTTYFPDGRTETEVQIDLMSKEKMMDYAMKHLGLLAGDGVNVNVSVGEGFMADLLAEVENANNVIDVVVSAE